LVRENTVGEKALNVLVIDDDKDVGYLFERLLGGLNK